ncbi:MAG: non-canonical purine NTP pyrophosphatase [Patescibacteria group bacterium]|nr:non-canonical purine NTP pyrophosphatase [Patescibacteria group bacterium]
MKTLTIGTTNPAKVAQIADALSPSGIEAKCVADKTTLPDVVEDGKTAQENARKKAVAYAQALNTRVLSMDNALYFDDLDSENQPGIYVRRIGGAAKPTDEKLLNHYQELVGSLGDRINGRWEFAVCIADPNGSIWETTIISPRIFTRERSTHVVPGYPLESIQIDPKSSKYIADMSLEEQALFWQNAIGSELSKFVTDSFGEKS